MRREKESRPIRASRAAIPGGEPSLVQDRRTSLSLTDNAPLPALDTLHNLSDTDRALYIAGVQAGINLTVGSATDAGYRQGWIDCLDHQADLQRAAIAAVRPYLDAEPYWKVCEARGEHDRAAQALARAQRTGLAA